MEKDIRIAFFDIDGTLASNTVRSNNIIDRIPNSAQKAIKSLVGKGIIPMLATGRGKITITSLVKDLSMDSYIASNGLHIVYQGEDVVKQFLSTNQVYQVLKRIMGKGDMSILLETSVGDVLMQQAKDPYFKATHHFTTADNRIEQLEKYEVYQITVNGHDLKKHIQIDIPELKAKIVGVGAMDIYPEQISKATGIEHVLNMLSLSKEQAIAFGDEENDTEMFQAVGTAVAMGNATEHLKTLATYITDTVDNDGIYKACKYFELF